MTRQHIAKFAYDRHRIERALFFLSNALQNSGHNSKPVFLHSIQVAEMLWQRGLPENIVIAGVLHDIVEDTAITIDTIRQEFGDQVALYVDALTASDDQTIEASYARSVALGDDVASIRAADLIQNSYYYHLATEEGQSRLRIKYTHFMDVSSGSLNESIAKELKKAYQQNVESLPH